MKLVIKFEEQIKLFNQSINYHALLTYIRHEFRLPNQSIEITFTDEEGDNIIIASEDDIDILRSYFIGKEYVKIAVKAVSTEIQSLPTQLKEQQPLQTKVKKPKNNKKEKKPKQKDQVNKKKEKPSKEKPKKNYPHVQQIKKLMNLAVVQLVDQRIKALIPCIQEQIHNPVKKGSDQIQIIHEGYDCSLCLTKPIKGIRYDCPTCPSFTICGKCQAITEHQHNLLKIKHFEAKPEAQPEYIDKICKLLIDRQEQLQKKKAKSLQKKKKEEKNKQKMDEELKEKLKNAKKNLSQLFGCEPATYNQFVKKNKKASLEQIVKKYVQVNKIEEQDFKQRLINLQNTRLCKKFKKQANFYTWFVREHLHFDFNVILKAIYELGVEKKAKKEKNSNESQEVKEEKVQIKKEPELQINQQIVEQKIPRKNSKLEGFSQLKGEKLQIFNLMIDFFGPNHQAQYIRFIEAHQSYGKEQILQNWANKFSHIYP